MNASDYHMFNLSCEQAPERRARRAPPGILKNATFALLSISKERSNEFFDTVAERIAARGYKFERFAKPTHTKPAPEPILQGIVERCQVVIVGLAD